jgi:hypothetical protein
MHPIDQSCSQHRNKCLRVCPISLTQLSKIGYENGILPK